MGTWSCPNTYYKAKALKKLLEKPLKACYACNKLYNLMGDDGLYDEIDKLKKKCLDADVRKLVAKTLINWLDDLESFRTPWEDKAIIYLNLFLDHFLSKRSLFLEIFLFRELYNKKS